MGADMLLTYLAHRADRRPNFDAGRDLVDRLTPADLDGHDWSEFLTWHDDLVGFDGRPRIDDLQRIYREAIDALEQALSSSREVSARLICGWWLYFTGGMSWGDSPTDAYEAITWWDEYNEGGPFAPRILAAIGFENPPTLPAEA